jgi:hypothetical protein
MYAYPKGKPTSTSDETKEMRICASFLELCMDSISPFPVWTRARPVPIPGLSRRACAGRFRAPGSLPERSEGRWGSGSAPGFSPSRSEGENDEFTRREAVSVERLVNLFYSYIVTTP